MNLKSLQCRVRGSSRGGCGKPDLTYRLRPADWDDSETALAHLGGAAPGGAKSQGDKLWEDNWDDDDVEEEFSAQLRSVSTVCSDESLVYDIAGASLQRPARSRLPCSTDRAGFSVVSASTVPYRSTPGHFASDPCDSNTSRSGLVP